MDGAERPLWARPPSAAQRGGAILSAARGKNLRLFGAVLLEQKDKWHLQHRHMQVKGTAELIVPPIAPETLRCHPRPPDHGRLIHTRKFHHVDGRDPVRGTS